MALLGIGSSSNAAAMAGVGGVPEAAPGAAQATLTFPGQQAAPGGLMGQPGSGRNVISSMLVGGAAGAATGAGYGLLAGMVSFLPHVTVPMGALIGGAAGAALGLVKGVLNRRKANLAMKAQAAAMQPVAPGAGTQPITVPQAVAGKVLQLGASGPTVRWTQKALAQVGVFQGKVSGKLDEPTQEAIRRYEVLKGVMPTGASTPDLRTALAQDLKLSRQFV